MKQTQSAFPTSEESEMNKFEAWLKDKDFNKDSDVLVVSTRVILKDPAIKVIKVKSFDGVAVIKSYGYF
jgi:hypothetical protein